MPNPNGQKRQASASAKSKPTTMSYSLNLKRIDSKKAEKELQKRLGHIDEQTRELERAQEVTADFLKKVVSV